MVIYISLFFSHIYEDIPVDINCISKGNPSNNHGNYFWTIQDAYVNIFWIDGVCILRVRRHISQHPANWHQAPSTK